MDEYDSLSHRVQTPRGVHSEVSVRDPRPCMGSCGDTWERFRRLAEQKESRIDEGHLMPDTCI